ncbi:hypothetical protein FACS189496_4730 [Bacilli bacterium]|nr:hypothetical protein FACS189496_4730 [Bacilli bacterium]
MTNETKVNRFTVDAPLQEAIENSGFLHRPLPLNREDSLENIGRKKKVLETRILWGMQSPEGWSKNGDGSLCWNGVPDPAGRTSMLMELPTTADHWPAEAPDGDYTPFCRQHACYDVGGENWEAYNRITFQIYPDCGGARTVNIALIFANDGTYKVPDAYRREGYHEVNLINRQWNTCSLEIPELPRDRITMLGFESAAYGRDRSSGAALRFSLGEIRLEKVEQPEIVRGWLPGKNRIAYSMSGYESRGKKTAILSAGEGDPPRFTLKDSRGAAVLEGAAERRGTSLGVFDVVDFSRIQEPGEYVLYCGQAETRPFRIGEGLWGSSIWKALNFIFCERCGFPVAEKHGICHGDVLAEHKGAKLVYNGGWHDAGDLSQQTLQTGDVTYSLLEMAEQVKGEDRALYLRLIEEAEWGLEFILKCRFGDGYRASSAGLVDWSDGLIGTMDDRPARVHNNSFDNLLYAAYEAHAQVTGGQHLHHGGGAAVVGIKINRDIHAERPLVFY